MEDRIIERQALIETLKRVMPQLTRRQLECLVLFYTGLTQAESGEVLGITQQAVGLALIKIWEKLG